jgi:hypothetical protein
MTSPTQSKPTPLPSLLLYGTRTSPDLTQASWFREEDKEAARAAAEMLNFSVIDINTDAVKTLTIGVHEGVLKGSGRMIVGSVSSEVYRRIEDYARKASGADGTSQADGRGARGDVRTNSEHRCGRCCYRTGSGKPRCGLARPKNRRRRNFRRQTGERGQPRRGIHRQTRKPKRKPLGDAAGRGAGTCSVLEREARVRRVLARDRQTDRQRRIHARMTGIAGIPHV